MSEITRIPTTRPSAAIRPLEPTAKPRSKKRRSPDDDADTDDPDAEADPESAPSGEIDDSGRVDLRV